ncbi:RNA polymerase sigma factor [Paenibacillus sp. JZ16]|uniref:RNA polymerase sigma factor n=1 Tax=Paenibacillus sp. JZ16 TaxID=1906272 RepID=UPI00188C3AD4|nr:sigma-70 family RNA polymerase sigma factor [Paenibacillus sp. JZ16]
MEDRTLLDGLAQKDPRCFETLVDRYSRYIAAVVAKVAGGRFNSYDVEEITGDVLVKLWTDGPKIMLRGDSLKPYLAIAARNHTLNVLRKRQRVIESELEDDAVSCPSAEALAILRQEKEAISGMVQDMGEPDREIFIRRYFYLEKVRDIASRLNMQEKAVTARIRRAKDKLRIHYETENP